MHDGHGKPGHGAEEEADQDLAPDQGSDTARLVGWGRNGTGDEWRHESAEEEGQEQTLPGQDVALAEARHDHQRRPQPREDEEGAEELGGEGLAEQGRLSPGCRGGRSGRTARG